MGWTYSYGCTEKSQIRDEILRDFRNASYTVLRHATVGNHLWLAIDKRPADGSAPQRAIVLCLLTKRDGIWGYKDMDETMGPYYYDCPLSLLALFPAPSPDAGAWRDQVRDYHGAKAVAAAARKQITPGVTIECDGCTPNRLMVVSVRPLAGQDANGRLYRIKPSHVSRVVTP